jgi:PAS domain S-box-containing protein
MGIFDCIDEAIYVADPYTYEILYANKAMQDKYKKPLIGDICYREIQNKSAPCEFCTNAILFREKGKPYRWEYHSPVVDRDFLVVDRLIRWPDGRDVRFELAVDITEHKRAEKEIAGLASIVSSSDDAIISKTLDGTITSWNTGAEKLYGYTAAEAVGRPIGLIMTSELSEELNGLTERIRLGERIEHYETVRVTKDGRKIDVSITISPMLDAAGNVVGASTIARDVTEHRRADRALKRSQFILAKSQEIAHVGNWAWNHQTGELNWSDEGFRIFGYRTGEIKPSISWLMSRVHPDDRHLLSEVIDAVQQKGKPGSIDYRIVTSDGSVRYVNSVLDRIVRDGAGRIMWAYGINQDVTDRKLAEERLKKSQFILAKSQEMAHVGNWAWNVQTGELNGSDENYRIFGYKPHEIKPDLEWAMSCVHPNDLHLLSALLESARRSGARGSVDYRIVRPDGSVRYVNTLADKVVRDKAGNVKWVYGITQDVTERKRVERALEEAKARAELYLDLMGHDIINMNQIAMGYLELAMDGPGVYEGLRNMLSTSLDSVKASSRLIYNVRKLQRISTGEMSLVVTGIDPVLRQTLSAYSNVPGTSAKINYVPDASGCATMADELLYDIFTNIVDNAIKHCSPEPSVNIRLEKAEEDGKTYCRVAVEDNGPGIPDAMKEAIFERMCQGDTKMRGSGLGLYFVKRLVGSYGGRVWAEDCVPGDSGKGSRFVVLLPAVDKKIDTGPTDDKPGR